MYWLIVMISGQNYECGQLEHESDSQPHMLDLLSFVESYTHKVYIKMHPTINILSFSPFFEPSGIICTGPSHDFYFYDSAMSDFES